MELASKYDPQVVESKWYQYWLDNKLFSSKPDGREPYTVVIPPPNVTGVLHMGHMLMKTYVVEVKRTNKGPQIMVSRTHPGLLKRLFELEVPEIHDGIVEIKSVDNCRTCSDLFANQSCRNNLGIIDNKTVSRFQIICNIVKNLMFYFSSILIQQHQSGAGTVCQRVLCNQFLRQIVIKIM